MLNKVRERERGGGRERGRERERVGGRERENVVCTLQTGFVYDHVKNKQTRVYCIISI